MEYPYVIANAASQDGELSGAVTISIFESGINIDETELVTLIRGHLAGLPNVTAVSATRFSVARDTIPEA